MAHHVDHVAPAHKQQALLAIGRKQHVAAVQCHALGHRHGLFAGGFDVEGELALALHAEHALIVGAHVQHVPQALQQLLV